MPVPYLYPEPEESRLYQHSLFSKIQRNVCAQFYIAVFSTGFFIVITASFS